MIVGIDLGTTNSAVALWQDGEAVLVPNALGALLTPSAVSIDKSGQSWVGAAALDRFATHSSETATGFKRMMGTDQTVTLGKRAWKAEDLSAIVLEALVRDVEAHTGQRPEGAVITVPAYFSERQRRATRRAGEIAGLEVKRLINEPTAAALAFGMIDKGDREPFLVFDLGGGTFDVSIVEMFEGIVEVRASAGDNRLGGDDFDAVVSRMAEARLGAEAAEVLAGLPDDRRRALGKLAAERTRRALSTAPEASYSLTVGDRRFDCMIDENGFEAAAMPLLKRLRDPVLRSLRDSGIEVASLSDIVLVGGATRMPVVRKTLTKMFGRFPNSRVHPDHAVALGAAVQAGLLAGGSGLEEIRITDVAPFTLGIDVADRDQRGNIQQGIFSPIIERNSPVPISRVEYYHTMEDRQTKIAFGVYQGESRNVSANIRLGQVTVPIPSAPAGEVMIEVRFTYDTSGLLEVDVKVPATGLERNVVIVDEEDHRDRGEIERARKALEALKVHPRDEAENIAATARAARCYEDFTGPDREFIGRWITAFDGALASQDKRTIAEARAALTAALDELEANPPL